MDKEAVSIKPLANGAKATWNFLGKLLASGASKATSGARATANAAKNSFGTGAKFVTGNYASGAKAVGRGIKNVGKGALWTAGAATAASPILIPAGIGLYVKGRDVVNAPGEGLNNAKNELITAAKDAGTAAGDAIASGVKKVVDDLNAPPDKPIASTEGSIASLFNMLSGMTGGTDYVPQKVLDMFPGHEQGAALGFKMGAGALLAAGLIGGYRILRHDDELIDIDDAERPGKDLASQISTTFQGPLSATPDKKKQKKIATEVSADNTFTPFTFMQTALPVGAFVLSAALAYKGADALMDKHRNYRLDKAIAEKENALKGLITTRARVAKGTATDDEVNSVIQPLIDKGLYMKSASQNKKALLDQAVQGVGLLSSAIVLASAIGAYSYASAGDENNLKYKAYKKALREYAKAKSGMTPITVAPADSSEYFSSIDQGANTTPSVARYQPRLDTDSLNKPISVSF